MSQLTPIEYEPNPRTGRPRPRCTICNKVAFATEELAKEAAKTISKRTPMVHYKGRRCSWWHVTRKKKWKGRKTWKERNE